MPPGTIAIVLVAAVAHAIWNTVSKTKRGDTVVFVWAYTCAGALLSAPFAAMPVWRGTQPLDEALLVGASVSAVLHVAYSLTLQTGYERFELGVVYPVARGTGPVLTVLLAIVLLGERLAGVEILGAVVIVAGIVVVAGNPFHGGRYRPFGGVLWGGATGATISMYTLWDSYSVTTLHLAPVTYFTGTFLIQSALLTPLAIHRRDRIRTTLHTDAVPILTIGVLSPLAYILVLTAMRTAPVALVAPLRESSIVIGSLLAWRLFHEGHLARRLIGTGIVLAGIAAISL